LYLGKLHSPGDQGVAVQRHGAQSSRQGSPGAWVGSHLSQCIRSVRWHVMWPDACAHPMPHARPLFHTPSAQLKGDGCYWFPSIITAHTLLGIQSLSQQTEHTRVLNKVQHAVEMCGWSTRSRQEVPHSPWPWGPRAPNHVEPASSGGIQPTKVDVTWWGGAWGILRAALRVWATGACWGAMAGPSCQRPPCRGRSQCRLVP